MIEYKVADGSICSIRRNIWMFKCPVCGLPYCNASRKKVEEFAEKHIKLDHGHLLPLMENEIKIEIQRREVEIWIFCCPYDSKYYLTDKGYNMLLKSAKQHLIDRHNKEIQEIADRIITIKKV